jgi:hypothetical protein
MEAPWAPGEALTAYPAPPRGWRPVFGNPELPRLLNDRTMAEKRARADPVTTAIESAFPIVSTA